MSVTCEVCLVAEFADETNLRAFVRYQAVQLDRYRSESESTVPALRAALQRVEDLEEIVRRLQPKAMRRAQRRSGRG